MYLAFSNLFPILVAFILGFNFKRIDFHISVRTVEKFSNCCLYSLLVLMGISVGTFPGIVEKLSLVGINALCIATASSLSIAITLKIFHVRTRHECGGDNNFRSDNSTSFNIINYIKDPLLLAGLVIIGFLSGYYHFIPDVNYEPVISWLLYLLIFVIAIKLSYAGVNILDILTNRGYILMICYTVIASYLGAAVVSIFLPMSFTQCLAVSSGFGWYTLSGILFTKMGDPLLGTIAFLCDLFREVIALLLIPTLSRLGNANIAIGVAGATAMDVTLPVIEKHCGVSYVPVALLSGGIITVIVPFFIPFFYSL
ncbi:lysine exporter LysO family protein [Salmonella enterica]